MYDTYPTLKPEARNLNRPKQRCLKDQSRVLGFTIPKRNKESPKLRQKAHERPFRGSYRVQGLGFGV